MGSLQIKIAAQGFTEHYWKIVKKKVHFPFAKNTAYFVLVGSLLVSMSSSSFSFPFPSLHQAPPPPLLLRKTHFLSLSRVTHFPPRKKISNKCWAEGSWTPIIPQFRGIFWEMCICIGFFVHSGEKKTFWKCVFEKNTFVLYPLYTLMTISSTQNSKCGHKVLYSIFVSHLFNGIFRGYLAKKSPFELVILLRSNARFSPLISLLFALEYRRDFLLAS